MSDRPLTEFGRRRPPQHRLPDAAPAPKRSRHVALLVMGTMAVGGGAYALMGSETCRPAPPPAPGMAAPAQPQAGCTSRGSSYSGGTSSRWSSLHFYGGDSSSRASASGSGAAESGSVSRGGFGGFAHAFGFGGS
jgi:hypothetical protein